LQPATLALVRLFIIQPTKPSRLQSMQLSNNFSPLPQLLYFSPLRIEDWVSQLTLGPCFLTWWK